MAQYKVAGTSHVPDKSVFFRLHPGDVVGVVLGLLDN